MRPRTTRLWLWRESSNGAKMYITSLSSLSSDGERGRSVEVPEELLVNGLDLITVGRFGGSRTATTSCNWEWFQQRTQRSDPNHLNYFSASLTSTRLLLDLQFVRSLTVFEKKKQLYALILAVILFKMILGSISEDLRYRMILLFKSFRNNL